MALQGVIECLTFSLLFCVFAAHGESILRVGVDDGMAYALTHGSFIVSRTEKKNLPKWHPTRARSELTSRAIAQGICPAPDCASNKNERSRTGHRTSRTQNESWMRCRRFIAF